MALIGRHNPRIFNEKNNVYTSKKGNTILSNQQLLLSRREAASQLGLSIRSVDFLIKSGKLQVTRFGSRVLIPMATLIEFVQTGHPERIRPKS
jgi:excisionase family DNA binding protein